jgi:hypothetical protein
MGKAYIDFKRLYKLQKNDSFFSVRAKSNLRFRAVKSRKVNKTSGLRCDQLIKLLIPKSQKQLNRKYSIYEMTQILSISTFDKTPINELFTENKINQKIKEQPYLFNNSEL